MKKMIFALAAGLALLGGTSAWADPPTLDFDVPSSNPTGSIIYAGGANPLNATNISIDNVKGLDTPLNNNVQLTITGGLLNFTSGNETSSSTVGTNTFWNFGAGTAGSITITGAITSPPNAGINDLGPVLLKGQIESATVEGSTNSSFKVAIAFFLNQVDSTLAGYFGLPGGIGPGMQIWSGSLGINFVASGNPPGGFTSTAVHSGDVSTTVPEPSSLALAGAGALGLIGYGLRRRKALGA